MRKTLSLCNMVHKRGAGLLIPAYFVLGIALVPPTLLPEMGSVQNVWFSECHKSCHVTNGKQYCTEKCSFRGSTLKTQQPTKMMDTHGSTGPTVPPKPVGTQGHKY